MTPHVEQISGYSIDFTDNGRLDQKIVVFYKLVPGTKHETGATDSPEATYAHSLVANGPGLVEVEDDLGKPCNPNLKP